MDDINDPIMYVAAPEWSRKRDGTYTRALTPGEAAYKKSLSAEINQYIKKRDDFYAVKESVKKQTPARCPSKPSILKPEKR